VLLRAQQSSRRESLCRNISPSAPQNREALPKTINARHSARLQQLKASIALPQSAATEQSGGIVARALTATSENADVLRTQATEIGEALTANRPLLAPLVKQAEGLVSTLNTSKRAKRA
jgi:hypothetical protein